MWARIHRWCAIVLVALLVIWSVTGLLFHLKPGWDRAYDQLSAERSAPFAVQGLVPLHDVEAAVHLPIQRLALFDTALGPLYRISTGNETVLVDAATGTKRSPLSEADARVLVEDAVARSAFRDAYGAPAETVLAGEKARVRFAGGQVVDIGLSDARISQRGHDTDRIDWLYRIHYLQLTGHRTVDRVLAVVGLALIWAVMIPGMVLFVRAIGAGARSRRADSQ